MPCAGIVEIGVRDSSTKRGAGIVSGECLRRFRRWSRESHQSCRDCQRDDDSARPDRSHHASPSVELEDTPRSALMRVTRERNRWVNRYVRRLAQRPFVSVLGRFDFGCRNQGDNFQRPIPSIATATTLPMVIGRDVIRSLLKQLGLSAPGVQAGGAGSAGGGVQNQ